MHSAVTAPARERAPWPVRVRDAVARFVFGHDVFVSYARADAVEYAEGLANALSQRNLLCYLDQWGAPPGEEVPPSVLRQVRRSTVLVVVGSPQALLSRGIRDEIREFRKTNRPVVPVRVGATIEQAWWYPDVNGAVVREEEEDAFGEGRPTQKLLEVLDRVVGYNRRTVMQRRLLWGTLLLATLATGWAVMAGTRADAAVRREARADSAAVAATQRELAASGRADSAEARIRTAVSYIDSFFVRVSSIQPPSAGTAAAREQDFATIGTTESDEARLRRALGLLDSVPELPFPMPLPSSAGLTVQVGELAANGRADSAQERLRRALVPLESAFARWMRSPAAAREREVAANGRADSAGGGTRTQSALGLRDSLVELPFQMRPPP